MTHIVKPNLDKAMSFKAASNRPFIKKDELIWVFEDRKEFENAEPSILVAMEEIIVLSRETIFSAWSVNRQFITAQEVRVHFRINEYNPSWLEEAIRKDKIGPAIRLVAVMSGWKQGKKHKHVYLSGLIVENKDL